jgi:phosphoribosyl 1,2-cyclic phosphodiesterase
MTNVGLVFLGTGGGRFATITQKRRTGGIRLLSDTLNMHVDPGPGALIYSLSRNLDPQKVGAILVSHSHPDHCTDAEVLIEAMTRGMTKKRGVVAAARSVLVGNSVCGPAISKYHQEMPERVIEAHPGVTFSVGGVKVVACECRHTDPDAVGFRLEMRDVGDIGYTSDTAFFPGIAKPYKGVRLLVLCVMRPSGTPWKGHMTTDDALKIVEQVSPEVVVATHFGLKMIFRGPYREARLIEEKTGVRTIAAVDGMHLIVGEEIRPGKSEEKRRQHGLAEFTSSQHRKGQST